MLYLSCMTTVERFWSAFAWAEPMQDNELHLITIGNKLQISGFFPTYKNRSRPTDLLSWYEALRRNRSRGKPNSEEDSPHVVFANADNDEKLIAFVKRFGPVVAEFVHEEFGPPHLLTAKQDLAELRRERFVYCSALSLVLEVKRSLARPKRRFDFGKSLIRDIVSNTSHWPEQWERERKLRKREPSWRPTELDRIQQIAVSGKDLFLRADLDGRIVICELLNTFQSPVFPNPTELHSSIRYGIRPLLYAILRTEFLHPRETGVCENTRCRKFFALKRTDQQFCSSLCSRHQRQRDYWQESGKERRAARMDQKRRYSR